MKMEVHLHQRLEQRMHLSQQMLQNLELLQLPVTDLRELIMQELQENPALEERQDVEEPEVASSADPAPEETPEDAARREILEAVEDQWFESERRTRRSDPEADAERRAEMLQNLTQESLSLRDHLTLQLALLEILPGVRLLCEHVIQSIDGNGYLPFSAAELVGSLPEEIKREPGDVLVQKIQRAIEIVQSLEPRGVGAPDVKGCLLLQLDEIHSDYPLLRKLIENHFEDVGANRLPKIAKAFAADPEAREFLGYLGEPDLKLVLEDVKKLVAEIARLNPKPGNSFSSDKVPKVFPEVVIKRIDGKYEVLLEDGWLPPISISRTYEEMLRERKLTAQERERVAAAARDRRFSREEAELLAEIARGKRLTPQDLEKIRALLETGKLHEDEKRVLGELCQERKLSKEAREFLKRKMDAGRKLITAIEQRRGTICRITGEIIKHQKDFFEEGIEHLRPLKMHEVADALGIHLSTVSRAISGKWVETPRGIFPLKFFFASAAPRSGPSLPAACVPGLEAPDEKTRLALMERIREILAQEDKKNPCSDLEIARLLSRNQGDTAARRTIAKYREEMGIPSSRLRRQY